MCVHMYIVFVRLFCEERSLFSSQRYYLPRFVCVRGCYKDLNPPPNPTLTQNNLTLQIIYFFVLSGFSAVPTAVSCFCA